MRPKLEALGLALAALAEANANLAAAENQLAIVQRKVCSFLRRLFFTIFSTI